MAPRVIPLEAMAFLKGALGDDGAIGITVAGVDPTPAGPRVRFDVPRMRRRRGATEALPDREAIAESVSRMVAMRWRGSPEPRPVPADSGMHLSAELPAIYDAPTETADGWHWLLASTGEWIAETSIPGSFRASQVKQKFGTLRLYYSTLGGAGPVGRIVSAAEWVSGAVCEVCGAPGSVRPGGWIRTLCEAHADAKRRR